MSTRDERARRIAYFSMEIALADDIPTYSGGLGVLAGDTLKSAAELNVPIVAVILLHRYGYFRQRLTAQGHQEEQPQQWAPESNLEPLTASVEMRIEQRPVTIQAWRYWVGGATGTAVPVILLDTSVAMDAEWDRTLTDHLYGGDQRYRLCQEAVLGLGGTAMLGALGYSEIKTYHMNEGHSARLALALLEQQLGHPQLDRATPDDIELVRAQCVFTTHTPIPAGHDQFPRSLLVDVLGPQRASALEATHCCPDGVLNMTLSWVAAPFANLYDGHVPEWRRDNLCLR